MWLPENETEAEYLQLVGLNTIGLNTGTVRSVLLSVLWP